MADPPDFETLARRYVELWQDQWTALATDPHSTQAMARMASLFVSPFAAPLSGMAAAGDHAPRTAAARPAPGGGDDRVDELARRIAELEERVARLEAAGAGGPRSGSRRRRS